jgi:hypothetical protein
VAQEPTAVAVTVAVNRPLGASTALAWNGDSTARFLRCHAPASRQRFGR